MDDFNILRELHDINVDNLELWIAEAEFGFQHLTTPISLLNDNSDILEVGCGSGILLAMLAEKYRQHNFVGIEPLGKGFSRLKEINTKVREKGVNLSLNSYENHQSKYDFIFCVNVFEHVDDWRNFLQWASKSLKEKGVFFVLSPNYGFPFESHFKIPIVINKDCTFRFFNQKIFKYEKNNRCDGLWASLNFVKKRDVITFCNDNILELGFLINDDLTIIDDMISRVAEDAEFKKRQAFIGSIATLMRAFRLLGFIKRFPNFLPYMKLTFTKIN